jgi:hypothetical protein
LIITSILHFIPLTYMFLPWARTAFSGTAEVGPIDLKSVFVPMSAISPRQVESAAEGCKTFLQWDMYCTFGALLLWVLHLSYVRAGYKSSAFVQNLTKYLIRVPIVGPGGALFWALWDRDEEALDALSKKKRV